jgi:hypothetical protein
MTTSREKMKDNRGLPYWYVNDGDDLRTIRIKAAKNIISIMTVLKEMDAAGQKETQAYHRAIKVLKQEGETYP